MPYKPCIKPTCPHLQPCPLHRKQGTWNPKRNLVAHNRWARQMKRAMPYCQRCGTDANLQAHHTHGIHDERGMVLCRTCHRMLDPHAR